jgi:hypothetical protein
MKPAATLLVLTVIGIAPAAAADPLGSLRTMVGTWSCTYNAGKTRMKYTAIFSYDLAGNWMRERDTWSGGGSDEGLLTYDPKQRAWTEVVVEPERSTVVFRAAGTDPNHVVYRSVYPDASMTDVFDRIYPTRYTLHFTQIAGSKTTKSFDTCAKT